MIKKLYAVDADDSIFLELDEAPLATDAEILAQPCVVAALRKMHADVAQAIGAAETLTWDASVAAVGSEYEKGRAAGGW